MVHGCSSYPTELSVSSCWGQRGHRPKWRPGFPWKCQQCQGQGLGPGAKVMRRRGRKMMRRRRRKGSRRSRVCVCWYGDDQHFCYFHQHVDLQFLTTHLQLVEWSWTDSINNPPEETKLCDITHTWDTWRNLDPLPWTHLKKCQNQTRSNI